MNMIHTIAMLIAGILAPAPTVAQVQTCQLPNKCVQVAILPCTPGRVCASNPVAIIGPCVAGRVCAASPLA